ncbi:MAG: hypothetical protein JSR17_06920 [Proteobacteria bacterium]|nr:hypothetical protein [Pseudomonadota bacterium]
MSNDEQNENKSKQQNILINQFREVMSKKRANLQGSDVSSNLAKALKKIISCPPADHLEGFGHVDKHVDHSDSQKRIPCAPQKP